MSARRRRSKMPKGLRVDKFTATQSRLQGAERREDWPLVLVLDEAMDKLDRQWMANRLRASE